MSAVIVAYSAAVTTSIGVCANVYVMVLCRKALRDGCAVQARLGLLPSFKIERRPDRHPNEPVADRHSPGRTRTKSKNLKPKSKNS